MNKATDLEPVKLSVKQPMIQSDIDRKNKLHSLFIQLVLLFKYTNMHIPKLVINANKEVTAYIFILIFPASV
jgi:hypothetical protein